MRNPYFVGLDLTYRCNLNCLHCYNMSGNCRSKELTDEEIIDACRMIATLGPQSICFCGGEPTLRKSVIFRGAKEIRKVDNRINVNFVTNGQLLDDSDIDQIVDSMVTMVQISLDGATARSHDWMRNKDGVFDKACQVLKSLHERGVLTAVSFIPTKKNIDEIDAALDLCQNLGVSSFRAQPLMVMGRADIYMADYELSKREYSYVAQLLNRRRQENMADNKMEISWGDPVDHLIDLDKNLRFPTFIIGAYGDILLSPYIPVSFGNIRKHPIVEYVNGGLYDMWTSDIYKFLSKKMLTPSKFSINKMVDLPAVGNGVYQLDILDDSFNENQNNLLSKLEKS